MKQFTNSRITALFLLAMMLLYQSCRKTDILTPESKSGSSPAIEHGFVDNDMVMYWNFRTAQVLGVPMRQPDRSRYFAIVEIAVHDALNNIKPKYKSYLLNERTQFANPNAAKTAIRNCDCSPTFSLRNSGRTASSTVQGRRSSISQFPLISVQGRLC